jgi:hypothetical protein
MLMEGKNPVLEAWEKVVAKLVRLNEEKNLFEVRSSSNPEWHDVDLIHGKCSCIGFSFRGHCKHLKLAREFSERNGISQRVPTQKDDVELPKAENGKQGQ